MGCIWWICGGIGRSWRIVGRWRWVQYLQCAPYQSPGILLSPSPRQVIEHTVQHSKIVTPIAVSPTITNRVQITGKGEGGREGGRNFHPKMFAVFFTSQIDSESISEGLKSKIFFGKGCDPRPSPQEAYFRALHLHPPKIYILGGPLNNLPGGTELRHISKVSHFAPPRS